MSLRGPDGVSRAVRVRVRNLLGDPAVAALLVDLEDVTEHLHARKIQAETEGRYRHVFDQSVGGVLLTAPDGRILEANPAFLAMLGYTEAEVR